MTGRLTGGGRGRGAVAVLAALAVAVQLWGLYRVTGPLGPGWFPHADKLQHAVGFALPVALVLLALGLRRVDRGGRPSGRVLVIVVGLSAVHAVLSEVVQHAFYTSRSGDPLDALADGVGVAVGALVGTALLRRPARRSCTGAASAPERASARTS